MWSSYLYEIPLFAAFTLLALFVWRSYEKLSKKSSQRSSQELIVLVVAVILGLLVIYGADLLGKASFAFGQGDAGTDTQDQYIPFYLNLLSRVRDGSLSSFNLNYGLGTAYTSYQSWLCDPFNLVLIPLGIALGESQLALVLVLTQCIKVLLAALLFDHLLTRYCETPLARIFGALIYAFSGYMLLWGQHYWLGSIYVLFTLLVLLLELHIERIRAASFFGIALCVGITVGWSAYTSFMALLGAAFYVLLRLGSVHARKGWKSYFVGLGSCAAPVACGLLLSSVLLLPYANFLLHETGRVGASAGPSLTQRLKAASAPAPLSWIPFSLSRLLGSGLINTGADGFTSGITDLPTTNFSYGFAYEFPSLGFSAAAFILFGQFVHWLMYSADKRTKACATLSAGLIAFYLFHLFLPTLFNALSYPNYRSSFVLALPLCLALSLGFERRIMAHEVSRVSLVISVLLTLAVLAWSYIHTVNGRLLCLGYILATLFICLFIALQRRTASTSPQLSSACVVCLMCAALTTSLVDGFFITNMRGTLLLKDFPLHNSERRDASTMAALDHLKASDLDVWRVDKNYVDWTWYNDSLIQRYAGTTSYNSTLDSDIKELYSELWPEALDAWSPMQQSWRNNPTDATILSLFGVRYILSHEPISQPWAELQGTYGNVYVYKNTQDPAFVHIQTLAVSESEAKALPQAQDRRNLLQDAAIVPDDIAHKYQLTAQDPHADVQLSAQRDDYYEGTISTEAAALVTIALPHTDTWQIRVDGSDIETFRSDFGLVGFYLPQGQHSIEVRYVPAGLRQGCILSGIGLIATICGCMICSQLKSQTKSCV